MNKVTIYLTDFSLKSLNQQAQGGGKGFRSD